MENSLTGTIDNIINSELALEREESMIEDEARGGDNSVNRSEIPDELFFMIQRAGDRLVSSAPALVTNATSNLAECFMGIRCKFDGGKVYSGWLLPTLLHCKSRRVTLTQLRLSQLHHLNEYRTHQLHAKT